MNLYLIRHADAVPVGGEIATDADRPLSEEGKEQSRLVGRTLEKKSVQLDRLVVSPLLRAGQTAELVLEGMSKKPETTTCEDLVPDGKPRRVAKALRKLKVENVALVGHMPQLEDMAGWLLGCRGLSIDFAKAGVALISCSDDVKKGCGTLVWFVTPEWMTVP